MAKTKPLIALHGSYFGYNFGDTLLCALFCKWLQDAGADVILPMANQQNQIAIRANHRGIRKAHRAQALIFCGGGYFGEGNLSPTRWAARAYLRHLLWLEVFMPKTPIHILGIGAGPVSTPWLRRKIIILAQCTKTLITRDEASKSFFTQSGILKDKITIASDAALALTPELIPQSEKTWAQHQLPTDKKTILLHLTKQDQATPHILEALTHFLTQSPDLQPVIITDSLTRQAPLIGTFFKRQSAQDHMAHKTYQSLKTLPTSPLFIPYTGDPWRLCALIEQADIILTNKLHVGIVGTAFKKYVISLPHHQKTPRFYRQLNLENRCLLPHEITIKNLNHLLNQALKGKSTDWTTLEQHQREMPYQKILNNIVKTANT